MKIKKAKTDMHPMPKEESIGSDGNFLESIQNDRPEICNLISIYCALSGDPVRKVVNYFNGCPLSKFKQDLTELVIDNIEPIGNEISNLMKDRSYIDKILSEGAEKAEKVASSVIKDVKQIVGYV